MRELNERDRRRPGAGGIPATLADGRPWLLAEPTFRAGAGPGPLTTPDVDAALDDFYERIVLGDDLPLADLLGAARTLLLANYDLSNVEASGLLDVAPGPEAEALATAVSEALFGPEHRVRNYSDWIRASFLGNGLGSAEVPASAVNDVLTLLLATGRTVPPSRFIDACRAAQDRESRERLI